MSYSQNNENLAREQLQRYVKIPAFREYLKEQILKWELWYRSHTEEINEHEGLFDKFHQELKELQGRDFRHSDFDPLGHAEICYENYRYIAAELKDNPGYKLLADREPVLFKEASVASIVALFWCDVNDSTWLVPEYDFLEPEGPFIEYLREQWEKPIQERFKHIDWFVEAAISAYESTIANHGVDAAISLRMSDIAVTELKSDQQSNQKPSEFESAGLETVTTADIGTNNSTNPKEQQVSSCETPTVAQPSEVLNEPADAPNQGATESEQDAVRKPIDKAKVERNDWLLEMRGKDHRPKMSKTKLSNELSKKCKNEPNWVHIEPSSIPAALREAYKRQTGKPWPFDGRGRPKKT